MPQKHKYTRQTYNTPLFAVNRPKSLGWTEQSLNCLKKNLGLKYNNSISYCEIMLKRNGVNQFNSRPRFITKFRRVHYVRMTHYRLQRSLSVLNNCTTQVFPHWLIGYHISSWSMTKKKPVTRSKELQTTWVLANHQRSLIIRSLHFSTSIRTSTNLPHRVRTTSIGVWSAHCTSTIHRTFDTHGLCCS